MNKNDQASDIYAENGDGSPVLSWLKSAYNALVFYGLDDQVGKSKRLISPLRPSSIKKSPFFTVSESIGQRILQEEAPISSAGKWVGSEEEKDRDDQKGMNNNKGSRFKIRPRSIKRTKYADAIIAQSTLKSVQECEDRLALLAEDLELLDVSIAAAELEDDTNSKIESLLSRRVQLLDDIEETQARLVTLAITELNDSSS